MEFKIKLAKEEDAEEICQVMHSVQKQLDDKTVYVTDRLEYIRDCIVNKGFAVTAYEEKGRMAGFLIVYFPGEDKENMGHYLGLNREELLKVAYMDSAAVLPQYRGHGLQKKLLSYAEHAEQMRGYCYYMATVSPDNPYSLHNLQTMGYRTVLITRKYGDLKRCILCKCIKQV